MRKKESVTLIKCLDSTKDSRYCVRDHTLVSKDIMISEFEFGIFVC